MKNMKQCSFVLAFILALQSASAQQHTTAQSDYIRNVIQHVSDTAIASDVRHLESYGTRYARFSNRFTIAEWIMQRFVDVGVQIVDTVGFVEGDYYTWQRNVVATIPGASAGGEEIIIGAHYDSQNPLNVAAAPGADDNASGVAGIIELARVLRLVNYQPQATIRFIAFAAEELGLYGSYDYADRAFVAGQNIILMQNYDMIGYRDPGEADRDVAINQYQSAIDEADLLLSLMQTYTSLTPLKSSAYISRSDSWPFALRGFKAVFVIEDDFNVGLYHTARDSSTYLDFTYAQEIIQAGIALTLSIDGSITGIDVTESATPSQWGLGQNYPNPFNPSTSITYSLPARGKVRLWVHSLLGETIAVIENSVMPSGTHTVRWVPDVSSGVYYYTLEVIPDNGDLPIRQTKKMMLLR